MIVISLFPRFVFSKIDCKFSADFILFRLMFKEKKRTCQSNIDKIGSVRLQTRADDY